MNPPAIPLRRRIGAIIIFYDLPAVQVWVAAAALGLGYGLQSTGLLGARWLLALVAMGLVFMYLMGINDLFDIEIDSKKHEHSGLVTGVITKGEAEAAVIVSGILGLVGSAFVSDWFFAFAVIIFLLSTFYSAPPVRFKRFYPFSTLGELAGGYFLFLLGVSILAVPAPESYLVSLIPALIAASMRLGHEAKYVEFDKATGKRTLAVVHGAKNVQRVVTILPYVAVALALLFFSVQVIRLPLTALSLAFIVLPIVIRKTIRTRGYLRPVSYFWGFLFFLVAIAVS
jgi:4-hydroxybenzoate polyprenyltransferase